MNELETLIRERLAALQPERLELRDDSAQHAGHKGSSGGGHFLLTIVSKQFAGLSPVARHQAIYRAMGDLMEQRVHALSISAKTPDET
jgi:BolA family transcriptional regulator, general stress-responsive regulator